jgi:hypothetical protein
MKIGVQCQSGVVQSFVQLLSKKPVAVLLLGNALGLDIAQQIRTLSPTTLILLRTPADNWALDRAWTQAYTVRAMQSAMPYLQRGLCDFLLPPNEPVVTNVPEAQLLNSLQVELAQDYHANGFQTGAYTNPVGNPPYNLLPYLRDGILACGGWWFIHSYGAPDLQTDSVDLSLRHRNARGILNIPNLKIGITECGLDLGIIGKGGGYRALPDNGHLIQDYVDLNLAWWDSELAKDPEVKFTTLFGYAMEHPWESFDVAAVDTDRAYFINWLQGGTTPPNGGQVEPTPAQTVAQVPFLVKASLQPKYGAGGLGQSIYGEYIATGDGNEKWNAWIFLRGGLKVKDGNYADFSGVKLFNPVDGTPLTDPLPWPTGGSPIPPSGIPPYSFPQALTDNGACGEEGKPIAGKPFYRVSSAAVLQGVSAFATIFLKGMGAQVVNLFPDGHGEVFTLINDGNVTFNFGATSAFTDPCTGPFTMFVAEGAVKNPDTKIVTWKNILSDKVKSVGDWKAEHSEWRIQFAQVQ